jgi:isochorismate synthase
MNICLADLESRVRQLARAADRDAVATRSTRYVVLRHPLPVLDPLKLFNAGAGEEATYWERPDEGFAMACFGRAAELASEGPDRFATLGLELESLRKLLWLEGNPADEGLPLVIGGFSFDGDPAGSGRWEGFGPASLVLPSLMVVRQEERSWCALAFAAHPGTAGSAARTEGVEWPLRRLRSLLDEEYGHGAEAASDRPELRVRSEISASGYAARVRSALESIRGRQLQKVVLSRACGLSQDGGFDIGRALETLRRRYPSCFTFAFRRAGGVFLGSTPERLARMEGRRLQTIALAGSAPRGRGYEDDMRRARSLLESPKEQREHAFVVRSIVEALEPYAERLDVPMEPRLLQLEGIQHLSTSVRACLRPGLRIPSVIGLLHPTAAVGGIPRANAMEWLSKNEALERGWYASPVGWVSAGGDGDFAVALRSGLIRGREAWLYAGAGIVRDSIPDDEFRETGMKLRALLEALVDI